MHIGLHVVRCPLSFQVIKEKAADAAVLLASWNVEIPEADGVIRESMALQRLELNNLRSSIVLGNNKVLLETVVLTVDGGQFRCRYPSRLVRFNLQSHNK